MKNILLLSTFILSTVFANAQLYKTSFDISVRDADSNKLRLAVAGGLNQPQFSNIDLNGDGIQDLFVFDKTGGKLLMFIAEEVEGEIEYFYDPSFEELFPVSSTQFAELKDFNDDGLPDLWFYQAYSSSNRGTSVEVHKNVSQNGNLAFEFHKVLYAYNFNKPGLDTSSFYQFTGNYPDIVDLDGDGDLDYIVNTSLNVTQLTLFLNNREELGEDDNYLGYEIVDQCLGNVQEFGISLVLDQACPGYYRRYRYKKKHSGIKTITFFDNDGDGDLDMLFGTSENEDVPMWYLENGKADFNMSIDTFISLDTNFFGSAVTPLIPLVAGAHLVDINNDGVKDLILSNHQNNAIDYPVRQTRNVLSFINEGSNSVPDFVFQTNKFLADEMIDNGAYSAPSLVDIDDDGDLDMFIMSNGDDFYTNDTMDRLYFYENIGSSTNADFILRDTNYLNLIPQFIKDGKAAFADIDGDDDQDLFIGADQGNIIFYENTGSASSPSFTKQTTDYEGINVGFSPTPYFYDLDEDGILDLLIGEFDGNINYYRNTGTKQDASFTLVSENLGNVVINDTLRTQLQNSNGMWVDSFVIRSFGFSSVAVANLSNDSTALIVGGFEGKIRAFYIPSNLNSDFPELTSFMVQPKTGKTYIKDWGERVHPAVADLDGDGIDDIIIGTNRGGIHFVKGILDDQVISIANFDRLSFNLYPNPTSGVLVVSLPIQANSYDFIVTDIMGRSVQSGTIQIGDHINLDQNLLNGVYFLQVKVGPNQFIPQKFIISR
ncbi:T9SS type A sorting domain-containing protein [bacterium]|nr:T9SS type A sorting domain-containing protein [bacterium]